MGPVVTDGSTVMVIFLISLRRHYPVRFVRSTAPSRPLSALGMRSRVVVESTLAQPDGDVERRAARDVLANRWARCLNDGMILNVHEAAETSADTGEPSVRRLAYGDGDNVNVGAFRFWFVGQRREWSDEVALLHGYEPGSVVPTTELLLSHKHPDDRDHVQDILDRALHSKSSFSSRHRFIDVGGNLHDAIVVADRMADESGAVVGTAGYYIDLTDTFVETRQVALDETLPDLFEARAVIEQVKGVLMAIYRVSAEQAFSVLRWRSQETNTKLRALAKQLIAEIPTLPAPSAEVQSAFDHLLLTVQEHIPGEPDA